MYVQDVIAPTRKEKQLRTPFITIAEIRNRGCFFIKNLVLVGRGSLQYDGEEFIHEYELSTA
ncbi:hypothetical protein [Bacillus piscicola]|uniref:hypothetical protein n=1 Tax=Bacillus piscicola TaxID=1632684 RepID=UPI001F090FD5|nr:hypothetical protein [Bacillus piscicola]